MARRSSVVQLPGGGLQEDAEGFVKQRDVLRTPHKQASQGVVEIRPATNLDLVERAHDIERPDCLDVESQVTEQAREVEQVREEGAHGARCFARFSISCTRSPRIAWMSSWFFSTIPSVWSMVSASSSALSSATRAVIQSRVSDTPSSL